jgi:RNA methyltransferase, TrmH family
MIYTSLENEKIKEIKKLHQAKYRNMTNTFLIEGEHLVEEAYKYNLIKELIVEESSDFNLDVDKIIVSNNVIKYLSELTSPPKVMAVCRKQEPKPVGKKILMLDQVQDPGNLGTIIRSAIAFNIDTLILSDDTVDLYNSKVVRASQGMLFHINIISANLISMIEYLKKNDYQIIGTRLEKAIDIKKIEKDKKFVIIVGNEGNGIKKEILDLCDKHVFIKTNNKCESLNVGVAASIVLYELDK